LLNAGSVAIDRIISAIAASTNGASATAKTLRLKASKLDADAGVKLNSAPEPQNFNQ
jgi:hypothetical protein